MEITRRARTLIRRDKAPACGWGTIEHTTPATASVDIDRDCGHHVSRNTPTCVKHLNALIETRGIAARAVPCPTCGVVSHARVVATHDLGENDNRP